MNHYDQAQQGSQTCISRGGAPAKKQENLADDYDFAAMRAKLGQKKPTEAMMAQNAVRVARPAEQPIQIVRPHCAAVSSSAQPPVAVPQPQAASPGYVDPLAYRKQAQDSNPVKDEHDFAALRANLGKKPPTQQQREQSQVYIVGKNTKSLS